jgi:phosphate-selective porin
MIPAGPYIDVRPVGRPMSGHAAATRQTLVRVAGAVLLCGVAAVAASAQEPEAGAQQKFELTPRGYVQFDWRGYPEWTVAPGSGRLDYDTLEVRRLRAGLDGQWRRLSFEIGVDPMDDFDGALIKDAYAQFQVSRALRIRAGQFKLPGSREYGTSATSLNFLERSGFAQSIGAGRDLGLMATGRVRRRFDYEAGVFAGDGTGRTSRAGLTTAARIEWRATNRLVLAGSVSEGRTNAVDSDPANGFEGRASSGYRFFERLYVQGRRERIGADVEWTPGRWRISAEALRGYDERDEQGLDREDLPGGVSLGWSSAIVREFGRRRGPARSRIREWDLGIRFDSLTFDDTGPDTDRDSVRPRATDVRARGAQTVTAGVSWNLARWARVMTNGGLERYSENRSAPEPSKRGNYWTLATRLQLELP